MQGGEQVGRFPAGGPVRVREQPDDGRPGGEQALPKTTAVRAAVIGLAGEELAGRQERVLGTAVDPETAKDIVQLDLEQNDANSIGDSEGMIDRMLADDTLWTGATGRTVTKPQILAVTRSNFQKNPTRTKKDAAPHDDFGLRRFGDAATFSRVQHHFSPAPVLLACFN